MLAYLPKPTVSRSWPETFPVVGEAPDEARGTRPARGTSLLTAALLLCAVLVGLTTAVLR